MFDFLMMFDSVRMRQTSVESAAVDMETSNDDSPRKRRKLSHEGAPNGDVEDLLENSDRVSATEAGTNVNDMTVLQDEDDGDDDYVEIEVTPEDGKNSVGESTSTGTTMSKNQLKRLRKAQEWEAGRDYRRAKRKQKTVEKKARKRAAREGAAREEGATPEGEQKAPKPRRPVLLPITFILDCGFDDLMSDKEKISLASQLTRAYSDNSRSAHQAHMVVSSWGGSLKERFDTTLHKHYMNWKGVYFESEDFVRASEMAKERMAGDQGGKLAAIFKKYSPSETSIDAEASAEPAATELVASPKTQAENGLQHNDLEHLTDAPAPTGRSHNDTRPISTSNTLPEPEIIYLTSDSPHTLDELRPHSTYIIGGLVDKNRHKGICYRTACDKGIKTAKLPIGDYMEMTSRFVLATNHVVEIMLRWLECGDWGEAFMKVIPKRKGGKLKAAKLQNGEVHDNDSAESEEDESPNADTWEPDMQSCNQT